jgi:hypothetical protein
MRPLSAGSLFYLIHNMGGGVAHGHDHVEKK